MSRTIVLASVVVTMALQLTGCCSSANDETCTATIRYKGKNYEAKSNKSEATRLACRRYCKTDAPEVDAAWRSWKATPEGAKSTQDRETELENRQDLFFEVNRCQGTCLAEMVLTPALATVSCKK
jgi:hypothetical protein